MIEQPKQTYFCKACNATFFSHADITEDGSKTGHQEYRVLAKWPET